MIEIVAAEVWASCAYFVGVDFRRVGLRAIDITDTFAWTDPILVDLAGFETVVFEVEEMFGVNFLFETGFQGGEGFSCEALEMLEASGGEGIVVGFVDPLFREGIGVAEEGEDAGTIGEAFGGEGRDVGDGDFEGGDAGGAEAGELFGVDGVGVAEFDGEEVEGGVGFG